MGGHLHQVPPVTFLTAPVPTATILISDILRPLVFPSNDTFIMAEPARRVGPMDNAHAQDWSVLDLGHALVSQRTIYLVDLKVDVWGVDEIAGSSLPVTCIVS